MKKSIMFMLVAILVAMATSAGYSWAIDYSEVQATASYQFGSARAYRVGDSYERFVILEVNVAPNFNMPHWVVNLGDIYVSEIQFVNHSKAVAVFWEAWHCGLFLFDARDSTSLRKYYFQDSYYVDAWKYLGEEKGVLVVTSTTGSTGKKYLKKISLPDGIVTKLATFPASLAFYFGWEHISSTDEWNPLVAVVNESGRCIVYRAQDSIAKVLTRKLPAGAKISYLGLGEDWGVIDIDIPKQIFVKIGQ